VRATRRRSKPATDTSHSPTKGLGWEDVCLIAQTLKRGWRILNAWCSLSVRAEPVNQATQSSEGLIWQEAAKCVLCLQFVSCYSQSY
jgi:hypothetical protein